MAMGINPVPSHAAAIHRPNAREKAAGSSRANTRSNVSGLGMPFASVRNRRKKASLLCPYAAMASQVSAPPSTAHVATTRMSTSRWSLLAVSRRGSGRSANTAVSGSTGMGILLIPSV